MNKTNKHDAVIEAIDWAKKSTFKATALKVELEAQLNRGGSYSEDDCGECNDGMVECNECWGSWDELTCGECEGSGNVMATTPSGVEHEVECDACSGSGETTCEFCDEGQVECGYCSGHDNTSWASTKKCQDFIFEKLLPLGLAKLNDNSRDDVVRSHTQYGKYIEDGPLKYGEFYNDGSVDSEFTFTISLEDSNNVFLIPKIIEVWKQLADEIGNGMNVSGAGMHTAWLNTPDCSYAPRQRPTPVRMAQYKNFQRSMGLLLPAMFFLASGDETSRGLRYRQPKVQCGDTDPDGKYSAISYRNCSLEFRAFNTCYDDPEQILDNIVVMRNCLRYWTNTYRHTGLERIATATTFGNDRDDTLKRFYQTTTHIDLLNEGLKKLKPSYLTIKQVKAQRKFDINKNTLKKIVSDQTKQAQREYLEYEERFSWNLAARRARYQAQLIEEAIERNMGKLLTTDRAKAMIAVENELQELVEHDIARKQKIEDYIAERMERFNSNTRGQYTLTA